jgi:putative ABC transport system permease protein
MRTLGAGVLPRIENVTLDWRVVLATVAATMVVGVLAGIPPAVVMRESASGTPRATHRFARMSTGLVIAQIALSVVLLVGAGLLTKGFMRVVPDDPGFALENRATVSMRLRGRNALPDSGAVQRFVDDVASRMRRVEGVRDVAVTSYLPFVMMFSLADVRIPGVAKTELTAFHSTISPNYFAVMEMPLRAGRAFTDADRAGAARTVIVNETAARKWFETGNAVGRRVEYTDAGRWYSASIVGVVRDARLSGTDTRVRPEIYAPLSQGNPRMLSFVAATKDDPRLFDRQLKQAVWAVAPRLPVESTSDLATLASRSVSEPRFFAASISVFAIAAAILATIGVYGVVSFAVTQQRQEIGIRIALGATGARITAMIARRAIVFGAGGIVIGLAAARGLSRLLEGLLLEVTATDAGVFGAIGAGMLVLAVIAGCVPAWQALRGDPVRAIRMP